MVRHELLSPVDVPQVPAGPVELEDSALLDSGRGPVLYRHLKGGEVGQRIFRVDKGDHVGFCESDLVNPRGCIVCRLKIQGEQDAV